MLSPPRRCIGAQLLLLSLILPLQCCTAFASSSANRNNLLLLRGSSYDDEQINNSVVSVTTQRTLEHVTLREARNAWIEYHWEKGGGLPIAILSKKLQNENTGNGQGHVHLERTILPIFMKERLEHDDNSPVDDDEKSSLSIHYKVTENGPFFSDLIAGSHSAVVTFDASANKEGTGECSGCVMCWNVTFTTTRWPSFYDAVTQYTVGTAATTIQEASTTPRLFSAKTIIDGSLLNTTTDPKLARRECLDFIFEGGGLPLLPPIPYGSVLTEGGGTARQNLLRIPPFITESIIDTTVSDDGRIAEFKYQLNDPGWLTFPFLIHTHIGRVRFTASTSSSDTLVVDWDVEIRPYKIASPAVEKLVEMTVSTLLRNLRVRLTEPGAVVVIKPPRGNTNVLMGRESFGSVAKETWLGGVLNAHLTDARSALEQTVTLLMPWTWGRSGKGDENDNVQFQWTDGHKI